MRIMGIAGSLRAGSYNRRLLVEAMSTPALGAQVQMWEGLRHVPPFDEDAEAEPVPAAVADLRRAIAAADAVLIATPQYNGSLPGVLKNALDWPSRPHPTNPLRSKSVAVVGGSPSPRGAQQAQDDRRRVLRVIGAQVVDTEVAVPRLPQRFNDRGALRDEPLRRQLHEIVARLAQHVSEVPVALAS